MRYELWLGWRYLLSQRKEKFVTIISWISIAGVALGVAALIVVIGVMSGFDHDLRQKIVGTNAHLIIEGPGGIRNAEALAQRAQQAPHVVGASPFVAGQAIVRTQDRAMGVVVRGIEPASEREVTELSRYLVRGHYDVGPREILVGSELAALLGLELNQGLTLIAPSDGRLYEMRIAGIFQSGMYEYDATLVVVPLALAQELFDLPGIATGIGIRLDHLYRADAAKLALEALIEPSQWVRTWMEMNATLFEALQLEKKAMFVILTLIVMVAAANIASTLIMKVMERTKDIGILKAIGATNRAILAIFACEGLLIGAIGTALGLLGGWAISWALATYKFIQLPSKIYYIQTLPVRLEWTDTAWIAGAAMLISFLATWYPAWQASRMHPIEALRYE